MWYLLMGHLIGDYALQTDRMAQTKSTNYLALSTHVLIYVCSIAVALVVALRQNGDHLPWLVLGAMLLVLYVIHWSQDYLKSRLFPQSKQAYYADQVLHLLQIMAIRWFVFH